MPPDLTSIRHWLTKADHDLRTAQAALGQTPPITDTAAFHAQQAVEKMLKAYLIFQGDPFEKIHDLQALLSQCVRHDRAFDALYDSVEPLSAYAVRFRYPGPADPSVEQVRSAIEVVEEVGKFVLSRLPQATQP